MRRPYWIWFVISAGCSCLAAGTVCLWLLRKMKSVHQKAEADAYLTAGGLHLTKQYDQYTHTTETRTKIQKESSGGSGGSTYSESGGGSGRSGKFLRRRPDDEEFAPAPLSPGDFVHGAGPWPVRLRRKGTPPVETETDGAMGTLPAAREKRFRGGCVLRQREETAEAELAEESLNLLYDAMAYDDQYAGAVAYLGYRKQGDSTPLSDWLVENCAGLVEAMPFLLNIPAEHILGPGYGDLFCIVPGIRIPALP